MTERNINQISRPHWYSLGLPRSLQIPVWVSIFMVFTLSFLDLIGWAYNITLFKSVMPQWIPMKIITAICFIFAVAALVIMQLKLPVFLRKTLPIVLAIIICLVSLLTIYAHLYFIRTGHESSLTGVSYLGFFLPHAARMAFNTAFIFLFIGSVLFLLSADKTKTSAVAHVIIIPATLASYFVPVSYLIGVYSGHALNEIPVALNSGIAFCGLCAAILLMKPDTWLLKVFTSIYTGGIFTRKLLPPLLILPVVIGWLRINGERAGLFESDEGVVLVVITYTVSFLVLVWLISRSVNQIDQKRYASEEELKKSHKELEQFNHTLNALGKSSQAMMHSENELNYLDEVYKIIIEDCRHTMVWIGYAQNDKDKSVKPVAYYGFDKAYIEQLNVTWDDTERGRGPTGTSIRTGKPAICKNMQADPAFKPWREEALKRGYASSIVLPLISEGITFGAISIYSKVPDAFSQKEIKLLSDLADDLAHGISYFRLRESERSATRIIEESEEKYRLLFERMIEGFAFHEIILDEKGIPCDYRFLSINPAFEKLTGLKAENIIGKKVSEVLPATEKFWIDTYGKVALSGESIDFENYTSELNSYFRVSAFCPKIGYFAVIFENITDRRKTEEGLRNSEDRLQRAQEIAHLGSWELDLVNNRLTWSDEVYRIFGFNPREFDATYEAFLDAVHPDDRIAVDTAFSRSLQEGKDIYEIEHRVVQKSSGEIRFVHEKCEHIRNESGKIIRSIGMVHDITERKLADDVLRVSEERYRNLVKYAPAGIYEIDFITGHFTNVNDVMCHILGYTRDEFLVMSTFDFLDKEGREHFASRIRHSQSGVWSSEAAEYRVRKKDGSFIWLLVNTSFNWNSNIITGATVIAHDITERKRADEVLKKSETQLKELIATKDKFFNIVAHDLKNPFTSLLGSSELLFKNIHKLDNEKIKDLALILNDSAKSGYAILQNLLDWSRSQTGLLKINQERINVRDIINDNILNLELFSTNKEIEMCLDVKENMIINADKNMINTILRNLMSNAVKFTHKGGKVIIRATNNADEVIISVKDTGIGIEEENIEKLFRIDTNHSMPGTNNEQGTGLGLKLSKEFVEKQGGKIWIKSIKNQGSEFMFSIPLKTSSDVK